MHLGFKDFGWSSFLLAVQSQTPDVLQLRWTATLTPMRGVPPPDQRSPDPDAGFGTGVISYNVSTGETKQSEDSDWLRDARFFIPKYSPVLAYDPKVQPQILLETIRPDIVLDICAMMPRRHDVGSGRVYLQRIDPATYRVAWKVYVGERSWPVVPQRSVIGEIQDESTGKQAATRRVMIA
jgi:hypothetical protein